MSIFLYGRGEPVDENSEEFYIIQTEVDEVNYPLENITDFDYCLDLKPPEKSPKEKKKEGPMKSESMTVYEKSSKRIHGIFDLGCFVRGAAAEL
ncbi:MAG: hypothetical protein EXX96DRAFT_637992 [Benjaminiella poitrasii]|nr:MAG: hypothetical protein EXX96DRAFT_637992 [Benjaminiella poitrasii]